MALLNRKRSKTRGLREEQAGKKSRLTGKRFGILALTVGLTGSALAAPPLKNSTAKSVSKTVSAAAHHWYQVGKASWYGGSFNGRKTANGERFDMNALTCAHRSLPLGSWVKVTNLSNNREVFLRVNDRGPVPQSRIIDLSHAAATRLGVTGLSNVRVERVSTQTPELMQEMVDELIDPVAHLAPAVFVPRS